MSKKHSKKSYICPNCKRKQTSVVEWQTASIAYEFNLKTGESEKVDEIGGEHEEWSCPECGADLPPKVVKEIETILGWK